MENKRLFIIGGAPSVNTIDLSLLDGEDVMVVNKSIELFDNPKYFVTMDYTFFRKIGDPDLNIISKSQNNYFILNTTRSVFEYRDGNPYDKERKVEYTNLNKFDNIIESNRTVRFATPIKKYGFANGENSGFCAIQLALLLDYQEINLIGFDMQYTTNKTHYHDGYNGVSTFRRNHKKYQNHFTTSFKILDREYRKRIRTITPSDFLQKVLYVPKITLEKSMGKSS